MIMEENATDIIRRIAIEPLIDILLNGKIKPIEQSSFTQSYT
jgi:hypothetical protein